jgi:hypothetical protein
MYITNCPSLTQLDLTKPLAYVGYHPSRAGDVGRGWQDELCNRFQHCFDISTVGMLDFGIETLHPAKGFCMN